MAKFGTLKNANKTETLYPATRTSRVYDENGNSLNARLSTLDSATTQNAGDIVTNRENIKHYYRQVGTINSGNALVLFDGTQQQTIVSLGDDWHAINKNYWTTTYTSDHDFLLADIIGAEYVEGATYEIVGLMSMYSTGNNYLLVFSDLVTWAQLQGINLSSNARFNGSFFTFPAKNKISVRAQTTAGSQASCIEFKAWRRVQ